MQSLLLVNEELASHQKISNIIICKDEWSIENELITPTMKIKRNIIEHKYSELITKDLTGEIIWEKDF